MLTDDTSCRRFYFCIISVLSYSCNQMFVFFRKYLRETLKLSNAEDLNRLTACALILLGHTFMTVGSAQVK